MKSNDALALIIVAYTALGFLVSFFIARLALAMHRRAHGSSTGSSGSSGSSGSKSTASSGSVPSRYQSGDASTSTPRPAFESSAVPLSQAPPPPNVPPVTPVPPPVGAFGNNGYYSPARPHSFPPPPPPPPLN
ncbi:hypothetical protein MYCTH_2130467 [Thermothelomyces thermophilus ATCC 42464]|uniref:Uncharacterized protein n=1 Tax=Thermothelomyces thermophilus (strain ATCC 42464 / BCRC 31852 / DSM 1799) TaxID=573729 RepID=G2QNY5_THET4|nr:uncharacterized protein MYCTH_2130467 [Thermothelomyces thermophilus ATCC 42464]AEO61306.1 hypothetical protein MYCTH_2130467 [Thermothelomyces thermophilus ATCC 42464]